VRQAAVVADCRDGHAESLHAFVVLAGDAVGTPLEIGASIRKELAVQIPTYMLPRKVHVIEQLPLTPNGKTDRRALAARVQAPSA
jgi:acyl-coenzyme A synthetase/AMP-(fatty) acid ligase